MVLNRFVVFLLKNQKSVALVTADIIQSVQQSKTSCSSCRGYYSVSTSESNKNHFGCNNNNNSNKWPRDIRTKYKLCCCWTISWYFDISYKSDSFLLERVYFGLNIRIKHSLFSVWRVSWCLDFIIRRRCFKISFVYSIH